MKLRLMLALSLCLIPLAALAQISGDYVETRTADVYTGQCFANGEVNLVGNEAIMGWRVKQGSWSGVTLDGLTVIAVVRAKATLGDPYADPYPAKSVIVVDDAAKPEQQKALVAFAHAMTGKMTENVEKVSSAPVSFEVLSAQHHGVTVLRAGDFVKVRTRAVNGHDHVCGNEYTYYPPLTNVQHAMAAVAVMDEYRGSDLNDTWSVRDKRSAFVGTFEVAAPAERAGF